MIFFTSDTHYWHRNIIEFSKRPFSSVEVMHAELVKRWNAKVGPEDTVYNLGDVTFAGRDRTMSVVCQLRGRIIYLKGNHDRKPIYLRPGLDELTTDRIWDVTYQNQRIVLCHYPILSWEKAHRGAWHLHGHCHGNIDQKWNTGTRIDVGVDAEHSDYAPLSFDEISAIMAARKYEAVDHHGMTDRE